MFLHDGFQSRLLQICCKWERVNSFSLATSLQETTFKTFIKKYGNAFQMTEQLLINDEKHCGRSRNSSLLASSPFK